MKCRAASFALALSAACSGAGVEPAAVKGSFAVATRSSPPPPAPRSPHPPGPLAKDATFRDLVAAVRDAAPSRTTGECILGGPADGPFRLEAWDAFVADLPDPPADLDPLLAKKIWVNAGYGVGSRVRASWGETVGGSYLDLVALTPISRIIREMPTPILVVTDKATYVGLLGTAGFESAPAAFARMLELARPAKAWIVTAEGDVSLRRVREVLALLKDAAGTVVLATPLPVARPGSTTIPQPEALCYASLGWPEPNGWYRDETLVRVRDALVQAAAPCQKGLTRDRGGTFLLYVRIDPAGRVADACVNRDSSEDPDLRACAVRAVTGLMVPKADKQPGRASFSTDLAFSGLPTRALCDG